MTLCNPLLSVLSAPLRRFALQIPSTPDAFLALIEAVPDAFIGVDNHGHIVFVNGPGERLFCYDRDELVGRPMELLVPGWPSEDLALAGDHRAGTARRLTLEMTGRRRTGAQFPVSVSLSRLEGIDVPLTACVVREIGDCARVDELSAQLAALVDSSDDAIVGKSLDGMVLSWNRGAERIFGYPAEEAVGRHIQFMVPPDAREDLEKILERVRRGEVVDHLETERLTRDGRRITVALTESPIINRDGEIIGTSAISRDVTERRRAETKFQALLEAAPDAMVGVDQAGCIALVNTQAERLFGYGRQELLGEPVEVLVPESARALHAHHRSGYSAEPTTRPMGAGLDLAGRRKDGSEFPAEISLSALETEDGLLVTAAIRDVSEQRQLEERLKLEHELHQSQRLESLGRLAGGVAHDFNNLLTVILSYAEMLDEDLPDEPMRRDVEEICAAAQRGAELIRQLLLFSRQEVARLEPLDLNGVVRDIERFLRASLEEHVELEIQLAPLPLVRADAGQLDQVLLNLAVNARDAMPAGGTLTIRTAPFDVRTAVRIGDVTLPPGTYALLTVADTGTGMESEVRERVFEPFFTTKPKGQGTGLGLATAYGIVRRAGGSIAIESEPGTGTTLRILLPAVVEIDPLPHPAPLHASPLAGRGERVVVVEDEEAVRKVLCRLLRQAGYDVVEIPGGAHVAEAVRCGMVDEADLLLTDVVMPKVLGREVAARVAARCPGIRVLYVSGYNQGVLGREVAIGEGSRLLPKPFTRDQLLRAVRETIGDGDPGDLPRHPRHSSRARAGRSATWTNLSS